MSKTMSGSLENNRLSILQAASRLFCDQGVDATSFTDISKAVNLSKGTIYYYYPSKDHLIYDVAEHHLNQVSESIFTWLETISGQPMAKESLTGFLSSVFQTEDECRLYLCLVNYAIMGNDVIKSTIREKITKWHTMVEVAFSDTGRTGKITDAIFTVLDSMILNRALGVTDIHEQDYCGYIAKYI